MRRCPASLIEVPLVPSASPTASASNTPAPHSVPPAAIAAGDEAVTVRVELPTPPDVEAIGGFTLHLTPAGAEHENCTVPEKPPVGSAVNVKFADWPIGIVAFLGAAEKLKSGGPVAGSTVITPSNPCC